MKKGLLALIGVLVVGGAVFFAVSSSKDDTGSDTKNENTTSQKSTESAAVKGGKNACEILTAEAAAQVLPGSTKSDAPMPATSSDNLDVSICTYSPSSAPYTSMSLLARVAKDDTAAKANDYMFGAGKPSGTQDVAGVGDKAYWNPQYGQLNVLKDGNWYLITKTTGTNPAASVQSDAVAIYQAIKGNF